MSSDALQAQIMAAGKKGTKCRPVGRDSKALFNACEVGENLSTQSLHGITAYEPTELVITAGAGTPLIEIDSVLKGERQMLGFEAFNGREATLGGAIACGLCGPARPFWGAVRDFVLGMEVINGRGQHLRFGGQVIKNVAGYDVSRLYSGSWGTLGVIVSASVRLLPRPGREVTIGVECHIEEAITRMIEVASAPLPTSGIAYLDGILYLRFSGFDAAVEAALKRVGGTQIAEGQAPWPTLADAPHTFFKKDDSRLYRLSLPPATPHLAIPGKWLIDWGGALRWLKTHLPRSQWQQSVTQAGGRVLSWPAKRQSWLATGEPSMERLQSRIRQAFDPNGVFS